MKLKFFTVIILALFVLPATAQERLLPLPPPDDMSTRATDMILNGGFEAKTDWTQHSHDYPNNIICDAMCGTGSGTAGPKTGTGFVWLGGSSTEAGSVRQSMNLTVTAGKTAVLEFWVWNGTSPRGSDRFFVHYATRPLFHIIEGDMPYAAGYSRVLLNLARLSSGQLAFSATSYDGSTTNFSLDDVSLHTNLHDLTVNGSFETTLDSVTDWTVANKTKDRVVCNGAPFGSCHYRYKGGDAENSVLVQNMTSPVGLMQGDALVASYWGIVEPGTVLTAVLKVKYANGMAVKVKRAATFDARYDDSTVDRNNVPWKLYQFPPLALAANVDKATIKFKHKSLVSSVVTRIDNVSVAQLLGPLH